MSLASLSSVRLREIPGFRGKQPWTTSLPSDPETLCNLAGSLAPHLSSRDNNRA